MEDRFGWGGSVQRDNGGVQESILISQMSRIVAQYLKLKLTRKMFKLFSVSSLPDYSMGLKSMQCFPQTPQRVPKHNCIIKQWEPSTIGWCLDQRAITEVDLPRNHIILQNKLIVIFQLFFIIPMEVFYTSHSKTFLSFKYSLCVCVEELIRSLCQA